MSDPRGPLFWRGGGVLKKNTNDRSSSTMDIWSFPHHIPTWTGYFGWTTALAYLVVIRIASSPIFFKTYMRVRLAQAVGRSTMAIGINGGGSNSDGTGTSHVRNGSNTRLPHPRPSKSNTPRQLLQQRRRQLLLRSVTLTMAMVGMGALSIMMLGPPHLPSGGGDEDGKVTTTTTTNMMNPFYGWQPDDDHNGDTGDSHEMKQPTKPCSWRQCFQQEQPPDCRSTCREGDMGPAPPPPVPLTPDDQWIPDVTMLHRMMLDGKDAKGRPWPPALDSELCEDIGAQGGPMDGNKECE